MILKNKPHICPFCGSDDTNESFAEMDENTMTSTMICHECDQTWTENFTLTYCGFSFFAPNEKTPKYFNSFGEKIE